MDGLIDQARSRLWKIVNELATARKNGQVAAAAGGLYEYGQDSIPAAQRLPAPHRAPEQRPGPHLRGAVQAAEPTAARNTAARSSASAVRELEWSRRNRRPEADLHRRQRAVHARDDRLSQLLPGSHRAAASSSTPFFAATTRKACGAAWKAGADLADGQYLAIDADQTPPPISRPAGRRDRPPRPAR